MFNKTLIILALCSISLADCLAQDIVFPDLRGFKKEMNYPVYTPDNLWDYINGGAEAYNALGFKKLKIIEYTRGRKTSLKLEIYDHGSPDMAFGIYALERSPLYNFIDIGVQGYADEDFCNFLKGRYYVKIYTHSKTKKALEAIRQLAGEIEPLLKGTTDFPAALALFPSGGKKPNEEMFIAENVMGHEFLRNAYRSSYSVDGSDFELYIFKNDSTDRVPGMVSEYLTRFKLNNGSETSGKVTFRDGYNGTIFFAWNNNYIILLSGLEQEDADLANKYIDLVINK